MNSSSEMVWRRHLAVSWNMNCNKWSCLPFQEVYLIRKGERRVASRREGKSHFWQVLELQKKRKYWWIRDPRLYERVGIQSRVESTVLRRRGASSTVIGQKGTFALTLPHTSLLTPVQNGAWSKMGSEIKRRNQLLVTYAAGRLDLVSDYMLVL